MKHADATKARLRLETSEERRVGKDGRIGCRSVWSASHYKNKYMTYEQLAELAIRFLPVNEPYVIIAESYSGPVAALLAAHPVGDLQAIVFVSSFVSFPGGRIGQWIAPLLPLRLFRQRAPAWILRWLLMDSATASELICEVQNAIARVSSDVLTRRLREALNANFAEILKDCTVRIVCLSPDAHRLLGTRALRYFVAPNPLIETVKIPGPHFLLQCAPDDSLLALQDLGLFGSPTLTQ